MTQRLNLVTGATGFCASHVIMQLLEAGERVIGTDLRSALEDIERREMLDKIGFPYEHENLTLIPADLLDADSVGRLFEHPITHVFHTASLYDYSAHIDVLRRINDDGTRNLCEAALAADTRIERFIHWSTCGVYGKPHTTRAGSRVNIPFNETSPNPKNQTERHSPMNAYCVSKYEQEQMVWGFYREQNLPVTVIRPGPMYGPGSAYGHGGIILVAARGLMRAVPTDARNYINAAVHVEDVAGFAVYIAGQDAGIGEDYNTTDTTVLSQYEFTRHMLLLVGRKARDLPFIPMSWLKLGFLLLAKAWGWAWRVLGVPRLRMIEPQSAEYLGSSYWLSNAKSRAAGYAYRFPDARDGLAHTVNWFKDIGWLFAADPKLRRRLMLAKPYRKPKPKPAAAVPTADYARLSR